MNSRYRKTEMVNDVYSELERFYVYVVRQLYGK